MTKWNYCVNIQSLWLQVRFICVRQHVFAHTANDQLNVWFRHQIAIKSLASREIKNVKPHSIFGYIGQIKFVLERDRTQKKNYISIINMSDRWIVFFFSSFKFFCFASFACTGFFRAVCIHAKQIATYQHVNVEVAAHFTLCTRIPLIRILSHNIRFFFLIAIETQHAGSTPLNCLVVKVNAKKQIPS